MLVSDLKGRLKTITREDRLVKPSSGLRSCLRNDPRRARVSLRLLARRWHPSLPRGRALPRSADGHSRVWCRTAGSSDREIASAGFQRGDGEG